MHARYWLKLLWVLAISVAVIGCKRSENQPDVYFRTPFQNESQFIVETIVSDLAVQMFYAAHHQLPDARHFAVRALEKPKSSFETPVYTLQITLAARQPDLKIDLPVDGPVWSPELYKGVAAQLAKVLKLGTAETSIGRDNATLLSILTDGTARSIESEDQELSKLLEHDFGNPLWHEEAAVLLGAFALRDHSGYFFDLRLPLCQMTAHLALAQILRAGETYGLNGQMARVMLCTLMNNRASAMDQLDHMRITDESVTNWANALRARLTGDYRPLTNFATLSMIERVAWFTAYTRSASPGLAWASVTNEMGQLPDFCRVAEEEYYSVETAHDLLRLSLPSELKEIAAIYAMTHGRKLGDKDFVPELNKLPGHGFSAETGSSVHVQVIGWGQWALFLQRHLCQSLVHTFNIYEREWGLPDDARNFNAKTGPIFGGLRLYPFVRVLNCMDKAEYHQSLDAATELTKSEPHLAPARCWNNLWFKVPFAELYQPAPCERLVDWFKHDPPPGTAYDPCARVEHTGLVERADAGQQLARLHALAPWDRGISQSIVAEIHKGRISYAQAKDLFDPLLAYDAYAMQTLANTVTNEPDTYVHWMRAAAELQPSCFFTLGDYALSLGQPDKAADYYEQGQAVETDSLVSATYASWRIRYYLKKGDLPKAQIVADAAADVYSAAGLCAKAEFFELTSNYDDAFEWYGKIEERYDDIQPLLDYCSRFKAKTGDHRFDGLLKSREGKLFPNGIEKVELKDFHSAPADGVLFRENSDLLQRAGLKAGDVIVALDGIRVHNSAQYNIQREISATAAMVLIVWQGDQYREVTASPPHHRFGVSIGDYRTN